MKPWLINNYLSLLVGLILPLVLSALLSFFRQPLEMLSIHKLSSLPLVFIILSCVSSAFLIYYFKI